MNSPYQAYKQSSVQTANGGQLIIMLYEGAIRFTRMGIEGIRGKDIESANLNFSKAQGVVNELIASLNKDYEIAQHLIRIYEYLLHLLIQANIQKNPAKAQEAIGHLTELLEAWKQAVKAVPSTTPQSGVR
ncbi:flagellar export chaperone FliS [Cohnella soli]|uniref:Flagellar secretion chaperone FliS n=1 Tax=Cohnella soli TaxID=425005 RepID=A0ABW0HMM3_9BACL